MTKSVTVLGSTGSIGLNTLDLVRRNPSDFHIIGLTANRSVDELAEQAIEFGAQAVAIADENCFSDLKDRLSGHDVEVLAGADGVKAVAARSADLTMAAIVGSAGLEPTLAAVKQGNTIALANKECLVCAGETFMKAVSDSGATLLPVDSEHNAIFQVFDRERPSGIRRLVLTASGGPFRETSLSELKSVTPERALDHPVWSMGAKISVDSATLMNKGLELIEAAWLFDRPSNEIGVVVHPQSVIHSMVEYLDGSVLAQMGSPDMRTPIGYALAWPDRMETPVEPLNFAQIGSLTFFEPDLERFPALRLAREALEAGGQAACVLNAANEVAVAAFLEKRIGFLDIAAHCERALEAFSKGSNFSCAPDTIAAVIDLDQAARRTVDEHIVNL